MGLVSFETNLCRQQCYFQGNWYYTEVSVTKMFTNSQKQQRVHNLSQHRHGAQFPLVGISDC